MYGARLPPSERVRYSRISEGCAGSFPHCTSAGAYTVRGDRVVKGSYNKRVVSVLALSPIPTSSGRCRGCEARVVVCSSLVGVSMNCDSH